MRRGGAAARSRSLGPGVRRDEFVWGASVLDVCPTALAVLGLGKPEGMNGNALNAAFEETPATPAAIDISPLRQDMRPLTTSERQTVLERLVADGFVVLPYMHADPVLGDRVRRNAANTGEARGGHALQHAAPIDGSNARAVICHPAPLVVVPVAGTEARQG